MSGTTTMEKEKATCLMVSREVHAAAKAYARRHGYRIAGLYERAVAAFIADEANAAPGQGKRNGQNPPRDMSQL
jgi:hypothetical protein